MGNGCKNIGFVFINLAKICYSIFLGGICYGDVYYILAKEEGAADLDVVDDFLVGRLRRVTPMRRLEAVGTDYYFFLVFLCNNPLAFVVDPKKVLVYHLL